MRREPPISLRSRTGNAKKRHAPYRCWPRGDWVKVTTKAWREGNKDWVEPFK